MSSKPDISAQNADPLNTWFVRLRAGVPISDQGLTLIPLYRKGESRTLRYRTLGEAIANGDVTVAEALEATIPTLRVINKGRLPVLIINGEEVVGGRQNRVVNTTLLVPAQRSFDLPVNCIEQGRWHEVAPTFEAGETAYPSLRSQMLEQVSGSYESRGIPVADATAVWNNIADRHRRVGSHSATGAMRDAYAERQGDLARAQEHFQCPDDEAIGVIAVIGGHARCADIFDQTETLRFYWPRLVRSYALEAIGEPPSSPALDSTRRFLQRLRHADRTVFPSPGLGQDVRISGNGVVGAELVCDNIAVHTALFRLQRKTTRIGDIRRPSERAERHQQ